MSDNGNGGNGSSGGLGGESLVGRVVFWVVVVVAAMIVLRLVFAAVTMAAFLAFRLLPIAIVVWVVYRLWKWIAAKPASSD